MIDGVVYGCSAYVQMLKVPTQTQKKWVLSESEIFNGDD